MQWRWGNNHPVAEDNHNPKAQQQQTQQQPTLFPTTPQFAAQQDVWNTGPNDQDSVNSNIYTYWMQVLLPALLSAVPILLHRIVSDIQHVLLTTQTAAQQLITSVVWPNTRSWRDTAVDFWDDHVATTTAAAASSLLRRFDTNGDGILSAEEVLNVTHWLQQRHGQGWTTTTIPWFPSAAFWQWFAAEWPLLEWKLGVFVWRTCGGILVLLTLLSIVPGRLHGYAAQCLRWPVLGITYGLITVELIVYGIIRVTVRVTEFVIQTRKHRILRRQMQTATSYAEWFAVARTLDQSQKRQVWLHDLDYDIARYNWTFIQDLILDLKAARKAGDALWAVAVLENCTRSNVGGIMSEDLFSYSNTGIPKYIVTEFIDQVTATLHWLTDEAVKIPVAGEEDETDGLAQQRKNVERYQQTVKTQVRKEKDKLWQHLVSIFTNDSMDEEDDEQLAPQKATTKSSRSGSSDSFVNMEPLGSGEGGGVDRGGSFSKPNLPPAHREQVLQLLRRARHAYGRTALCLSGGAMMGLYHCGHIRALLETGCLPHIVSGTSAGSVLGAVLCTRTDDELAQVLKPEVIYKYMTCFARPWKERIKSVWKTGYMFSADEWEDLIKWFTNGDLTFEEAYRRTGRTFCITLSSTSKKASPVLLNHLSAPNVVIASAVIASAAVPGFIPPVRLKYKDSKGTIRNYGKKGESFWDGSIQSDIPTSGLAEMLNVHFFIVCQCNPHIVPFFYNSKGKVGRPSRWSSGTQEHSWRGGFLLAALEMYLKNDMKAKLVFLNDLEASVGFTAQLFTQGFVGSTTIVPQASFWDYFWLFSDPMLSHLYRYFQAGSVAAYEHVAMIKCRYCISDALDECIAKLSNGKVTIQERPTVTFEPLKAKRSTTTTTTSRSSGSDMALPPEIAKEDIPRVVPRIMKDVCSGDGDGMGPNSSESLTTVEDYDYEDETNWIPIGSIVSGGTDETNDLLDTYNNNRTQGTTNIRSRSPKLTRTMMKNVFLVTIVASFSVSSAFLGRQLPFRVQRTTTSSWPLWQSAGSSPLANCYSANEFSRLVDPDRVLKIGTAAASGTSRNSRREYQISLEATEEECNALAKRFEIPALGPLNAQVCLRPASVTLGVEVEGSVFATLTQKCVRTNDEFTVNIELPLYAIVRPVMPINLASLSANENEDNTNDDETMTSNPGGRPLKNKRGTPKDDLDSLDVFKLQNLLQDDEGDDELADVLMEDQAIYPVGGQLDVGELVAQLFWLQLDPYPKKPGSEPIQRSISG